MNSNSIAVPGCPLLPLQLRAADQPALLLRVAHRQREVGLGARGAGFWGTRRHCIGHPGTTSRRTSRGTGSGTTRWSSTSRSAASSTSTSTLKPSTKVLRETGQQRCLPLLCAGISRDHKRLCCLCCKSGPISAAIHTDRAVS